VLLAAGPVGDPADASTCCGKFLAYGMKSRDVGNASG